MGSFVPCLLIPAACQVRGHSIPPLLVHVLPVFPRPLHHVPQLVPLPHRGQPCRLTLVENLAPTYLEVVWYSIGGMDSNPSGFKGVSTVSYSVDGRFLKF